MAVLTVQTTKTKTWGDGKKPPDSADNSDWGHGTRYSDQ